MNKLQLSESECDRLLAHLKNNYEYDAEHGTLVNIKKRRMLKGHPIGKYLFFGYSMNGKKIQILFHRVIWAHRYGRLPTGQLDHINGDKHDNRIENLREVTDSENKMNKQHEWKPNEDTGVPGVCSDRSSYGTKIRGRKFDFRNPYEAFFHATMCGKRYLWNK
jgi:hypothetical protein